MEDPDKRSWIDHLTDAAWWLVVLSLVIATAYQMSK